MIRGSALAILVALCAPARADDAPKSWLHAELDPFPFATLGYGGQIGIRHPALRGVRVAVASFMVNVPDVVTEMGGNDGFELRVRPSGAIYVLYYFKPPGRDGFAVGGSLRYLRLRYRHAEETSIEANVDELSPEAIAGYQWHPFENGFYLQPWLGLGFTLARSGEPVVGNHTFDPLPIQPFFTVNIGYEHAL